MIDTLVLSVVEGHVLNRGAMAVRSPPDRSAHKALTQKQKTRQDRGPCPCRRVSRQVDSGRLDHGSVPRDILPTEEKEPVACCVLRVFSVALRRLK